MVFGWNGSRVIHVGNTVGKPVGGAHSYSTCLHPSRLVQVMQCRARNPSSVAVCYIHGNYYKGYTSSCGSVQEAEIDGGGSPSHLS